MDRIIYNAVNNSIRMDASSEPCMPVLNTILGTKNGTFICMAALHKFKQEMLLLTLKLVDQPFINNKKWIPFKFFEKL